MVRVLPLTLRLRWWAWCNGPPWWQEQECWPQRLFTRARLAASTGLLGAIFFNRASSICRICVGCLGISIPSPPAGKYSSYRDWHQNPLVRRIFFGLSCLFSSNPLYILHLLHWQGATNRPFLRAVLVFTPSADTAGPPGGSRRLGSASAGSS